MAVRNISDEVKLLRETAIRARLISDHMNSSPGGDQYTYEGPTGDVDGLRDVLDKLDWGNVR